MSKNVFVFCEQRDGEIQKVALELIGKARELADALGQQVVAVLPGYQIEEKAQVLIAHGADEVVVADDPMLADYATEPYAQVIDKVIKTMEPEAFLFGASSIGRDLAPRVSARVHTGLTADCTGLEIDDVVKGGTTYEKQLKMTRPAFGGNLMATIICPRFRPSMATVRPGVMKKAAYDEAKAKAVKVTKYDVKLDAADLQTEVVEVVKAAKKLVDLVGADYIVSVGRGISKDVEGGIKLAHELADVLGGVVGGSRVAIDSGWLTADHQVGQTGKTVHPKVYVALGISGSIQHKAGMSESECIIAVNKNDTAPIFEIADYGICGDLFKVTPMLIEAFKAAKASK